MYNVNNWCEDNLYISDTYGYDIPNFAEFWFSRGGFSMQANELFSGQGIPRYWLKGGRTIGIERAATHFGPMSLTISSETDESQIKAVLTPPERTRRARSISVCDPSWPPAIVGNLR